MISEFDSEKERICGRCKYHRRGDWDEKNGWYAWHCNNSDSDCYLSETAYKDHCLDFEPRVQRRF